MAQLDLDFSPAPIVCFVAWAISQDILISKLNADFRRNVWQLAGILNGENPPARHLGDFAQQRRAIEFFRRAAPISKRVKDAHGIKLGIGLFYQAPDIAFVVPTVIIAPVRYYEQSTFSVVRAPHLTEPQINGIEESSAALGRGEHHTALQVLDAIGVVTG